MSAARRGARWFGALCFATGCSVTYVPLGDDVLGGTGGTAGGGGNGASASACEPNEPAFEACRSFLELGDTVGYNGCLNRSNGGIGGGAAEQCDGYPPCSYQHEGCLAYYSGGLAGSNASGCAGAPGDDPAWLQDCGGLGYYNEPVTGGFGGGSAGEGGAGTGAGGEGRGAAGAAGE